MMDNSDQPTIVYISANGGGMANFSRACRMLGQEGHRFDALGRTSADLSGPGRLDQFLGLLESAGNPMLLVRFHGGKASCPFFDRMAKTAKGSPIFIDAQSADDLDLIHKLNLNSEPDYQQMVQYMHHDGVQNWYHLIRRLLGLTAPPPAPRPPQGLYHPDHGVVQDLEAYLKKLGTSGKDLASGQRPVIGIWFFPVRWLDNDMAHIDALVREVERQGNIPICCFYRRSAPPGADARDTQWIRDHYLCWDGRPLIHVLVNLMCFSLGLLKPEQAHLMGEMDIPILNAMELYTDREKWQATAQGVSPLDVSASFAQPEFDGYLSSVPVATRERCAPDPLTGARVTRLTPIPDRITKVVAMAGRWATLKLKPNHQKKIAVIFHCYPPRNDAIGTAVGLDTFQSVHNLVLRLEQEGFTLDHTYDDAKALAHEIISGLTCDRRWSLPEDMAQKAADIAGPDAHEAWHANLPAENREEMAADWGDSPGTLFTYEKGVLINGKINGNLYLGVQPPRGHIEQKDKIHDPLLTPGFHYIYFYNWLSHWFKADAVIHVGTHGSLEWLPGKSAGMSRNCYPDLAIGEIPHIYPYIVNIPSEGTQAKRRTFPCIIDHMIPVMTHAGLYEGLAELETMIPEYIQTGQTHPGALPVIRERIWQTVETAGLETDLNTDKEKAFEDFDAFVTQLQDYLTDLAGSAITQGLHVLGTAPDQEGMAELITQMVRIRAGDIPSLHGAVAALWGYDLNRLLDMGGQSDDTGRFTTCAQALSAIREAALDIVRTVISGAPPDAQYDLPDINRIIAHIRETILPGLAGVTNEMDAIIAALEGRFITPGASGNPTRGQIEILPTGRNFYSVDPEKIPTRTAWKVGKAMARSLIATHREETGTALETMGMVLWGSNEFRNWGEDIGQALFLMGVCPVWDPRNGRVTGLKVIPASQLDHPRVDITFRISGFFRDGLPHVVELLDEAVMMVGALNEPGPKNILRRTILKEAEALVSQGIDPETARREAGLRIFGCAPGTYGAGVSEAVHAQAWETSDDLGEVFVNWGGYAYGKGIWGQDRRPLFRKRLSQVQAVVKNEDNREHDLFTSDDFNSFFGGYIAAVAKEAGRKPRAYSGDSSNPDRVACRNLAAEVNQIFRTRLLNPKWIQSMVEHGVKGAGDLSRTVDFAFAWDATSQVIHDWMYQALAEKYALDPEMNAWFRQVSPYALQNIAERLLEAVSRGMWQPEKQTQEALEALYLEVEGDIEAYNESI